MFLYSQLQESVWFPLITLFVPILFFPGGFLSLADIQRGLINRPKIMSRKNS